MIPFSLISRYNYDMDHKTAQLFFDTKLQPKRYDDVLTLIG